MASGSLLLTRTSFDLETAVFLAQASAVAYWPQERVARWSADQGFTKTVGFDRNNVQGYWCAGDGLTLLVFRGTSNPGQWLRDARFFPARHDWGHAHIGFRDGVTAAEPDLTPFYLLAAQSAHVWIAGHSLGGALALLAAAQLKARTGKAAILHTYGQPAVGLNNFAERFAIEMPQRLWRFVNQDDIVTRVPPWPLYRHTGIVKHIVRPGAKAEANAAQAALESAGLSHETAFDGFRTIVGSAPLETADAIEKAGLTETQFIDIDSTQLSEQEFARLQIALGGAGDTPAVVTQLEGNIPFIANHAIDEYVRLLTQLRDASASMGAGPTRTESAPKSPFVSKVTEIAPATDNVNARARRLRSAIAARQRAAEGVALESLPQLEGESAIEFNDRQAEETLSRIVIVAETTPERDTDRVAFDRALAILREHGSGALKKLAGDPRTSAATLSADERASLEAIVIADGARPSFLLENGSPPLKHPFMGVWAADVAATEREMRRLAGAIGRIQPKFGGNGHFIGTASLVDRDKGIILTNFHVLDDAMKMVGSTNSADGVVTFDEGLEIDFIGEAYTFDTNIFRIVEAKRHSTSGRGFDHLDAVTMRIEPSGKHSRLPEAALSFSRKIDDYQQASGTSLCTIGFPGRPIIEAGTKVDWDFVIRTLFGNQFGVKRLAPGRVTRQPGAVTEDGLGIVFGHDATTFGGASGSPVFAWGALNQPAVGLHFAGGTEVNNYAIAVARVVDALVLLGVPM